MLDILFISDYVCPYCLVAKEALKQALEEMKIEVKIMWQPLELTVEPAPRVDTYSDERRRANYQVLVEPCKQLGLDMKLPPKVIPRPYSKLAFEGWYFAQEKGLGEVYNDLIYRAYFIDEKDIGDMEVLTELAEKSGLNRAEYKEVLVKGTFSQMEKEAVDYARNVLKPEGVPTVYINGNKITLETYTKEEMLQILRRECYGTN